LPRLLDLFDIAAFERAELHTSPCPFFVVQQFVKPDALARANADYPQIPGPGNYPFDRWPHGDGFRVLLDALTSDEMRDRFAEKLGIELGAYPTQMTVRRFVAPDDGHIHNDAKTKKITVLVYFNDTWDQPGGRLRILRSERNLDDYAVEVEPSRGTLLAFRRNHASFHGYAPCSGERRAVQLHWVDPKRAARGEKRKRGPVSKFFKRALRGRK
jgi:hypothetical protein